MTTKRLSALQWFAFFAGVIALATGHVLGIGLTYAECNIGGGRWGIANDPWEMAILSAAALAMTLSAVAAGTVIARTQDTSYEDDPPLSRIRFFAIAALVMNLIFVIVMMLDLVGNVFNTVCRGG